MKNHYKDSHRTVYQSYVDDHGFDTAILAAIMLAAGDDNSPSFEPSRSSQEDTPSYSSQDDSPGSSSEYDSGSSSSSYDSGSSSSFDSGSSGSFGD